MTSLTPALGVLVPSGAQLLAQDDGQLFLGEDFLPWIVLALGAAMVAGNVLALLRPPEARGATGADSEAPTRPPVVRAVVMIVIGLIAAVWGVASLIA